MNKNFFLKHEADMLMLGAQFAEHTEDTAIFYLQGQLGAGKTTFVRGFLNKLGFTGLVKSPTYTLVETYHLPRATIYHFDFYRIHDPKELQFIGIEDYFTKGSIALIEWPENGKGWLPPADLSCYIEHHKEGRNVDIKALSQRGEIILQRIT